jgi:hypothetical protein
MHFFLRNPEDTPTDKENISLERPTIKNRPPPVPDSNKEPNNEEFLGSLLELIHN